MEEMKTGSKVFLEVLWDCDRKRTRVCRPYIRPVDVPLNKGDKVSARFMNRYLDATMLESWRPAKRAVRKSNVSESEGVSSSPKAEGSAVSPHHGSCDERDGAINLDYANSMSAVKDSSPCVVLQKHEILPEKSPIFGFCKFCKNSDVNEQGRSELLVKCNKCKGYAHPSCVALPDGVVPRIQSYCWECNDCKACFKCKEINDEDKILICDACDRGYHMSCTVPPLRTKPSDEWWCPICKESSSDATTLRSQVSPLHKDNAQENRDYRSPSGCEMVSRKKLPRTCKVSENYPVPVKQEERHNDKSADLADELDQSEQVLLEEGIAANHGACAKDAGSNRTSSKYPIRHRSLQTKADPGSVKDEADEDVSHGTPKKDLDEGRKLRRSVILPISPQKTATPSPKRLKRDLCDEASDEARPKRSDPKKKSPSSKKDAAKEPRSATEESPKKRLRRKIATADDKDFGDSDYDDDDDTPLSVFRSGGRAVEETRPADAEEGQKANICLVPVEELVRKSDLELFEQARKNSLALLKEMRENKEKTVKCILFARYEIDAWYQSRYPMEYCERDLLFICEFCLKYMKCEANYARHMKKCTARHPPGDEIYRKGKISVFEVDGETATVYCQNLCLMAKLFLDHKTLYFDVAPFLFYIMTIADDSGCHILGYFSKEKNSFLNYNVSCILVLPQHMKKGYGKFLIDFSYLLTKSEDKVGSPERPLSDLGLLTYRSYWTEVLVRFLIGYHENAFSIKDLSHKTGIHPNDIVETLQYLGILKYWKGQHLIHLRKELMEEYVRRVNNRSGEYLQVDPDCLQWTPKLFKK